MNVSFQTLVEETTSREIYEDSHSLLKEMLQEMSIKVDAGLSFKFKPTEPSLSDVSLDLDANLDYEKRTMIREMSNLTNAEVCVCVCVCRGIITQLLLSVLTNCICICHTQNKSFMRVKGRLQLSTYRMRSYQLQVAEEFLAHVKSLPLEYEKGIYFAFLEDYGTHYTKNGKSGGEYELVYVLNQDVITAKSRAHAWLESTAAAIGASHADGFSLQGCQSGRFRNASKSASTPNSPPSHSRTGRPTSTITTAKT